MFLDMNIFQLFLGVQSHPALGAKAANPLQTGVENTRPVLGLLLSIGRSSFNGV